MPCRYAGYGRLRRPLRTEFSAGQFNRGPPAGPGFGARAVDFSDLRSRPSLFTGSSFVAKDRSARESIDGPTAVLAGLPPPVSRVRWLSLRAVQTTLKGSGRKSGVSPFGSHRRTRNDHVAPPIRDQHRSRRPPRESTAPSWATAGTRPPTASPFCYSQPGRSRRRADRRRRRRGDLSGRRLFRRQQVAGERPTRRDLRDGSTASRLASTVTASAVSRSTALKNNTAPPAYRGRGCPILC